MKILLLDFDGVIHSYTSGWAGEDKISDDPVDGAFNFIKRCISEDYTVCIYSARSKYPDGVAAMKTWFLKHGIDVAVLNKLSFPIQKPAAYLTIDDRAIQFDGKFPSMDTINNFKPWYK